MTQAYPLAWPDGWPRTAPNKQAESRFNTSLGKARDFLINEVKLLGGKSLVVSTNVPLRNDGKLYASFSPDRASDQGAAVYFQLKGKPIVIACDRWWRVHENIQAIAKTVEALRGIERWGASEMMHKAFDGFLALPPPNDGHLAAPWRQVLGLPQNTTLADAETAYRMKCKTAHPDVGGDAAAFNTLTDAIRAARESLK